MATESVVQAYPVAGGVYRHYKGGFYRVVVVAFLESDKTAMVVYRPANGKHFDRVWVRPVSEWVEMVVPLPGFADSDLATVPRFKFVGLVGDPLEG